MLFKLCFALKWDAAEDTSQTQYVANNANNNGLQWISMRTGSVTSNTKLSPDVTSNLELPQFIE